MAQEGDTITYTFSGSKEQEDISGVSGIRIDYIDGSGGGSSPDDGEGGVGGAGGRVENVTANVSGFDTLHIWVGGGSLEGSGNMSDRINYGRYNGGKRDFGPAGAGSSEVSVLNTDASNSDTEPYIAAAGGGGGAGFEASVYESGGHGGARGGVAGPESAVTNPEDGEGNAPPQGGDGADRLGDGFAGDGGVAGHGCSVPILDSGTVTEGGGNGPEVRGEIQISYISVLSPPSNLQITDSLTEGELTLNWDEVSGASNYNVYRAQASGSSTSDYTLVAEPTSPPYTDTALEDGEKYYYRVTSEN